MCKAAGKQEHFQTKPSKGSEPPISRPGLRPPHVKADVSQPTACALGSAVRSLRRLRSPQPLLTPACPLESVPCAAACRRAQPHAFPFICLFVSVSQCLQIRCSSLGFCGKEPRVQSLPRAAGRIRSSAGIVRAERALLQEGFCWVLQQWDGARAGPGCPWGCSAMPPPRSNGHTGRGQRFSRRSASNQVLHCSF